jgi:hypothetical protein
MRAAFFCCLESSRQALFGRLEGGKPLSTETAAGFAWYKDFALGVCVLLLFILGSGEFIEAFRTEPHNQQRLRFGLAMLFAAVIVIFLATCKRAVIAVAAGILGSRGLIAFALQPRPAKYVGLAAAVACGGVFWLIIRSTNESEPPYDSDKSSWLLNFAALFAGVALAAVLIRSLMFLLK